MPTKYISEIPYDSVTDNQVELSTESSLDSLYRTIRDGSDNVLIEYPKENSGAFNAYEQLTDSLETLRLKSAYNNLGLNESRLVEIRSTDIELNNNGNIAFNGEITDVIIISGGTGYTAGELYTEDTYGSGFKATYTVNERGEIDSITVINSGSGYVNPPTLLFTVNSKTTSTATLIPIMSASADTNNKLVLPLKMSLIDTDRINSILTVSGSLIPAANNTYDLGNRSVKWKDLYLEGETIYIGNMTIGVDGTGSDAKIKIRNTDRTDEDGGDLEVKSDNLKKGATAVEVKTDSGDITIEQTGVTSSGDVKIKVPDGQVIEFYEGDAKQAWISSTGIFTCNWLNLNGGTSITMIVDNLNASGNTTLVTQNAVVTGLNAKQDTLTFGKLSGNALKSEEALATGDVLVMGANHVEGLPAASFKSTLNILGLEGGTLTGQLILNATDGNSAPSTDGHILDTDNTTFNDNTTSASGTVAQFYAYKLSKATLTATNDSITTTDAATLYLEGTTVASTNQTITNNYALQLGGGNIKLPNDSKILFGDAGEYIKGDGTDLTIASSGNMILDCDGGDVTIQDSGTAKPTLTLSNTSDAYGTPPIISFLVNPNNNVGASGDDIGRIDFKGDDAGGNVTTYTQILSEISTATDGSEGGKISLRVASHDAEMNNGLIIEDGSEEDEVDVTIGNGDNSLTIIKGKLAFGDSATSANIILDEDNMATDSNTALATQQSIKAYVDSSDKFFCTSAFYHGANNLEYIPIAGGSTIELSSLSDGGNDDTTFIVPYNLKINTIYVSATRGRSTDEIAGSTNMRLYKNYAQLSANVTVNMSTIGYDSTDLATVYTFDFSSETNTYAAGDIMQISIDPTLKLYYVSITIVGLYT